MAAPRYFLVLASAFLAVCFPCTQTAAAAPRSAPAPAADLQDDTAPPQNDATRTLPHRLRTPHRKTAPHRRRHIGPSTIATSRIATSGIATSRCRRMLTPTR